MKLLVLHPSCVLVEMSWRVMLWNALDVVLRVPPLFALNSIFTGTLLPLMATDEQLRTVGVTVLLLLHLTGSFNTSFPTSGT